MMKKYYGKIMTFSLVTLVAICFYVVCIIPLKRAQAVPTITSSVIDDWAAVAVSGVDESTAIDISGNYATAVHIQAFLDSTTAHEGTEFEVQISGMSSGDEDWTTFTEFIALVDTANSENITNNPLGSGSTTITVADTGGEYETEPFGKWIAIEDSTLANSELIYLKEFTVDTQIKILDGTTNEHAQNTTMYDIAISRTVVIPFGSGYRARVICNNAYDTDGTSSSLNWKVGKTVTTDMEE
jgi:hypothetical protein